MFCPQCKTEYRPGFTKCADCGVDLVTNLPPSAPVTDQQLPANFDGLDFIWSTVSGALANRIHDALDAEHIFNRVTDRDFRTGTGFSQGFYIWVKPKDSTSAQTILQRVLGKGASPVEIDVQSSNTAQSGDELPESQDSGDPVPDDIADDPDPDDATAEVWSGDDADTADFIANSLRGVGVGCVIDDASGRRRVMVLPSAEKSAREVVREIVEDSPPQ